MSEHKQLEDTHNLYHKTTKDLERTTERLIKALDVAYNRPGVIFWSGVIKGLGQGLGATIGVAIVFLVFSWILRQLGGVPFAAEWINNINGNFPLAN